MFIELHREGAPTLVNFNTVSEIEESGEKARLTFIQLAADGSDIWFVVDESYGYVAGEIKKYQKYQRSTIAHSGTL